MKKALSLVLAFALLTFCFSLAGCGSKAKGYDYNLEDYITLPDYKNIKVDTESLDYKMGVSYQNYSNFVNLNDDTLITETELTKGEVEVLDKAIIDYSGKKDGVKFEGGTASDQELQIGSSSFIAGFESGLVGVKIGDTVDLNLTFPENYGSEELAGADVVFTVTVKKVIRPKLAELTPDVLSKLGYSSEEDYTSTLKKSYLDGYVWGDLVNNTKVKKYPEAEMASYIDTSIEQLKIQAESNGTTMDAFLSQYSMTEESYREQLEPYAESHVTQMMLAYAIARAENIEVKDEDVDEYINTNYQNQKFDDEDWQNIKDTLVVNEVKEYVISNIK